MQNQRDPHTFSNYEVIKLFHMDLKIRVNFVHNILSSTVTLYFNNHTGARQVVLDTNQLEIHEVLLDPNTPAHFELGEERPWLGRPLIIDIKETSREVTIRYTTSPQAAALQWLKPEQTFDKKQPFLFTQGQAILTRSWIPCQDTPSVRFTYAAYVDMYYGFWPVMSAHNYEVFSDNPPYYLHMNVPIPSYLMSLAVGNIAYKKISRRTGVYAEPGMLDKAHWEFGQIEEMVAAAEKLYGPYQWHRFDVLLMPPSFPFGGMENPKLTFATPTILAGDRSLVSLVAHELAHSWSGNLVTNATWNDFWLNEGFTVYFERRIMEAIEGESYARMLAQLGRIELDKTLRALGHDHPDTCLYLNLEGRDPDEGVTPIAYEKGFFFLLTLESLIGRERFDAFMKEHFTRWSWKSISTRQFVESLEQGLLAEIPGLSERLRPHEWIYQPGLPDNCVEVRSERFEAVRQAAEGWQAQTPAAELPTQGWSSHEWLYFLHALPESLDQPQLQELDAAFGFTQSGNSEILCAWLELAIRNHYAPALDAAAAFLQKYGRRKFQTPLFRALLDSGYKELAQEIYRKARPNYHFLSTNALDSLLDWKAKGTQPKTLS